MTAFRVRSRYRGRGAGAEGMIALCGQPQQGRHDRDADIRGQGDLTMTERTMNRPTDAAISRLLGRHTLTRVFVSGCVSLGLAASSADAAPMRINTPDLRLQPSDSLFADEAEPEAVQLAGLFGKNGSLFRSKRTGSSSQASQTARPTQPAKRPVTKPPMVPALDPSELENLGGSQPPASSIVNAGGTRQSRPSAQLVNHSATAGGVMPLDIVLPDPSAGVKPAVVSKTTLNTSHPKPAPTTQAAPSTSSQPRQTSSKPKQSGLVRFFSRSKTRSQPAASTPQASSAASSASGSRSVASTQTNGLSEREEKKARIAAEKARRAKMTRIAPPVAPPIPMSLRPGYGAKYATSQPKLERIAPSDIAPPPAPPAGDVIVTHPPASKPSMFKAPSALPSINELPPIPSLQAPPAAVAAAPVASPAQTAAAPIVPPAQTAAAKPIDLTSKEPKPFPLKPLPNMPLAMPKHSDLFPDDGDRFVDPELIPIKPAEVATQPARPIVPEMPPATAATSPIVPPPAAASAAQLFTPPVLSANPNKPSVPQPPAVKSVRVDDSVATVSIDSLKPKPSPLQTVPQGRSINGQADGASDQFKLPALSVTPTETGMAGFCPVALNEQRKLVDADAQFESVYLGRLYRFADEQSLAKFHSNPRRFAPAARGRDVVLLANGGGVEDGKLDHAVWFRGRLYLFTSVSTMKAFTSSPSHYLVSN